MIDGLGTTIDVVLVNGWLHGTCSGFLPCLPKAALSFTFFCFCFCVCAFVCCVFAENDTIVVCGLQGPIVTSVRALLTPHPMKELRVKGDYLHHKKVKAAMGIKISAAGLEHAVAGMSRLRVVVGV